MKNNKEIGEVIKDQLEGYELTPGDHVWKGIQRELDRKKKRRALVFWLFGGGLSLGLLGGFLFGNLTKDCEETTLETVIITHPANDGVNESHNSNSNESVSLQNITASQNEDSDNDVLKEKSESKGSSISAGSGGFDSQISKSNTTNQKPKQNRTYDDFI